MSLNEKTIDCGRTTHRQATAHRRTTTVRLAIESAPRCTRIAIVSVLALLGLAGGVVADEPGSVGVRYRVEQIVLPGPELEAAPLADDRTPVVVRVVASYPHGTAWRYDLEYYALEPGQFDLRDYLRCKDNSEMADVPPIPVTIEALLPTGQVEPNAVTFGILPSLGGYRTLAAVLAVAWIGGLIAILTGGRKRRSTSDSADGRRVTLADRLRPIVEAGIAGELTRRQQAQLERMLLEFWRKRLDLQDVPAAEAIQRLREHDEAGQLLNQLENWLHCPDLNDNVDVAELLRPYQQLPADAIDDAATSSTS